MTQNTVYRLKNGVKDGSHDASETNDPSPSLRPLQCYVIGVVFEQSDWSIRVKHGRIITNA